MANSNKNDTINEAIWSDTGDEVFSSVKDEVVQVTEETKGSSHQVHPRCRTARKRKRQNWDH